jgi:Holliday junction resolvase RusA-like endonuclease
MIETGAFQAWEAPAPLQQDHALAIGLVRGIGGIASGCIVIPGEPPSKGRPRATIRNGRIQTYTPAETRKAETRLAWQLKRLGHHTGPVALALVFYRSTRRRVDLDNLQKAVLDAATTAGTWDDDSQVKAMASLLMHDPAEPRIIIAIGQAAKQLSDQLEMPA